MQPKNFKSKRPCSTTYTIFLVEYVFDDPNYRNPFQPRYGHGKFQAIVDWQEIYLIDFDSEYHVHSNR